MNTKRRCELEADVKEDDTPQICISELSGDLASFGIYRIAGKIDIGSLQSISDQLLLRSLLSKGKGGIRLYVNSPGGVACEAWPFIDLMESLREDVVTIGTGEILSFGAMVVAAGTKGMRYVTPHTSVMVHDFSAGIDGNYAQLKSQMKNMDQEYDMSVEFWKKHSRYKRSADVEKYLLGPVDHWFTPKEAMYHGIIDGIWNKRKR